MGRFGAHRHPPRIRADSLMVWNQSTISDSVGMSSVMYIHAPAASPHFSCAVERRAFLAGANPCAVERCTFLAGANPARQLSLQPVASRAGHGGNEMA